MTLIFFGVHRHDSIIHVLQDSKGHVLQGVLLEFAKAVGEGEGEGGKQEATQTPY